MATLTELIKTCQRSINDVDSTTFFTIQQYTEWINNAIRELSLHFPRTLDTLITCTVGGWIYDLPLNCLEIISVEYPVNQDPPLYLTRKSFKDSSFHDAVGYYDFYKPSDSDAANPPQLLISERATAITQKIQVNYHAAHDSLSTLASTITIPNHLLHLIPQFVHWKALQALSTYIGVVPDQIKSATSNFQLDASRAYQIYIRSLSAAQISQSPVGGIITWNTDETSRIY